MKKHFILTAFLMLLCVAALQAQYRKMEIYELACAADLIVQGKISDQDPLNFVVEVGTVLGGTYAEKTLSVAKFRNTKVAKRWGKYTVGEEIILFLRNDNGHYHILGEGGEGEKLVMGAEICIDSRGVALKNRFGYFAATAGVNIYAEKVPAADLTDIVKKIRDCYGVSYVERPTPDGEKAVFPVAKSTCENARKDELRGTSWVHDMVIEQAETAIRGAQ